MKKCINDHEKYYTGKEPSPKGFGFCAHAENKNTFRIGKDGKIWRIVVSLNNSKRWSKVKGYLSHNNRSRTYFVQIINNNKIIIRKNEDRDDNGVYDKIIKRYNVIRIIPGKSIGNFKVLESKKFDGNSVLLQLTKHKYVYIGDKIYEFTMLDELKKYHSLIGNNDVPYPVLVGTENIYFMLDGVYVSRELVKIDNNDYEDAYGIFYKDLTKKCTIMKNIKIIDK